MTFTFQVPATQGFCPPGISVRRSIAHARKPPDNKGIPGSENKVFNGSVFTNGSFDSRVVNFSPVDKPKTAIYD